MLKWQKTKVTEMLDTLAEAHAEVQRLFVENYINTAMGLLAECQQFVECIVNLVSDTDVAFVESVSAYYESLYNASILRFPLSGFLETHCCFSEAESYRLLSALRLKIPSICSVPINT